MQGRVDVCVMGYPIDMCALMHNAIALAARTEALSQGDRVVCCTTRIANRIPESICGRNLFD